ncbi:MAG: hypothetical protein KJ621_07605 [Proteobacteria bacterium]|nr:hypothetical protein [Pseudomonadota bacterium]
MTKMKNYGSFKEPMEDDMPTVVVEVQGGVVQNVYSRNSLPVPLKVTVRDYDNLDVDPQAEDDEWLLKESGDAI